MIAGRDVGRASSALAPSLSSGTAAAVVAAANTAVAMTGSHRRRRRRSVAVGGGGEEFDQLAALHVGEARADADVLQRAGVVEQAEQQ